IIASEFFSKPFNRYDLEAVLDASTVSSTEYVRSLGVALYKVSATRAASSCPTFFNLQDAPAAQHGVWSEVVGGSSGDTNLLGIFFEFCGSGAGVGCREKQMVNPTILVNASSDRWTLIHEMMHFNFNRSRKMLPDVMTERTLQQAAKYHADALKKHLEAFKAMPNRQDLTKANEEATMLLQLGFETLVRTSLEDIAIEGTLIDLWSKGLLTNVTNDAPRSGLWYMNYSRDLAAQGLTELSRLPPMLLQLAEENFWPELIAEIKQTEQWITDSKNSIDQHIKNAETKMIARGVYPDAGGRFSPNEKLGFIGISGDEAAHPHEHIIQHVHSLDRDKLVENYIQTLNDTIKSIE
ncbi:MAG: hypothetical protein RBT63_02315, partial [Bdellovibrionales bacterium]|nr:hypothetical protein [Bdellovibrionales bacterium]